MRRLLGHKTKLIMSTRNVLLGTITGFALGAITGILFAPKKGSKTRRQIKEKGDDYVDELKSKFDEFSDSFIEKFETAQKDAENLAENGKSKFEEVKKEVKDIARD